jgi:hypothetical protein
VHNWILVLIMCWKRQLRTVFWILNAQAFQFVASMHEGIRLSAPSLKNKELYYPCTREDKILCIDVPTPFQILLFKLFLSFSRRDVLLRFTECVQILKFILQSTLFAADVLFVLVTSMPKIFQCQSLRERERVSCRTWGNITDFVVVNLTFACSLLF